MFILKALTAVALLAVMLTAQNKITVAAAADLGPAFKEIASAFERQAGIKAEVLLGSSGNFFAQIQSSAPYDIFFSADREYAKKLQDSGLATDLTEYAEGAIVVWVRKDSKLDVSRGMDILRDSAVKKIAIANPSHAPYGHAAMNALEYYKLAGAVREKLVLGENISQTMQFVQTGNADVGIVALSLALSPATKDEGKFWQIPHDAYPPIRQAAVVLKSSKNQDAAKKFLAFVQSPDAQQILRRYGFVIPEKR
jgi:molybdate transport system substrate-binding protein